MKRKEKSYTFIKQFVSLCLLVALLGSCNDSIGVADDPKEFSEGIYILCEGLWRQDNSTVSHYDTQSSTIVNDVFGVNNPTLRLGDTGNDILVFGKKCFVAMSTSKSIEIFSIGTTKSLGRIVFDGKIEPRSLTILNDTLGYVTTLGDDSVIEFNPFTNKKKNRIPVGPAPEGISHWKNLVFVANSGYGDFRSKEPLAGSVSVIDSKSNVVQKSFYVGPNLLTTMVDTISNTLLCFYAHLPSKTDSLSGIVQYSLPALEELRRWRIPTARSISLIDNTTLLFLTKTGVSTLDTRSSETKPFEIIQNSELKDIWTGVSKQIIRNSPTIVISNSKNYSVNGSLLFYSTKGIFLKEVSVGLNPTKHIFYSTK